MGAAVDDVHHRHRHLHAGAATEVTVQRQAGFFGSGPGHGHGNRQHGIRTQARLVGRPIQVDQGLVQKSLFGGVQAQHRFADFGVDVLDRLQHAFAQVARFVAITQFNGFTAARGGARGHGRAAHHAAFQQHITLHRGVATAVQHFAADDINDCTHGRDFLESTNGGMNQTPSTANMRIVPAPWRTSRALE